MKTREHCVLVSLVSLLATSWACAAELKLTWRGLDDETRLIELTPDGEAIIDILVVLSDEDTLSTVFFFNEAEENISQTSIATELTGWDAGGASGPLGGGTQQVAVAAANPAEGSVDGPGEFLIGSQTVKLDVGTPGDELEIAVATGQGFGMLAADGASFTLTTTGSATQDLSGFVHITSGSPGYSAGGGDDVRDPLIVRVADSGGGAVGDDGDEDGVPDDEDAFPEDPDETADTDDDGIGNNADTDDDDDGTADEDDDFPVDPDETTDTDNDGVGNNADSDDDNDGILDVDDDTPQGNTTPDNGNDNSTPSPPPRRTASSPCGAGLIVVMPLGLVGLTLLHAGHRRWRAQ